MDTRTLSLVAVFSALNFTVAALNRFLPGGGLPGGVSIGHITIDAVFCTCFLFTVMKLTNRVGVASLVGLVTGLLMLTLGVRPSAIASWFTRGLVLDVVVFGVFRHKVCGMKCYSIASFLAFFMQTFVGKGLTLLLFMKVNVWIFFLKTLFFPMVLAGSIVSIAGAYLASAKLIPLAEKR